ncbi:MAG: hypothetical protein O7G85_09925 [Planctomycetota bacterium]|nr:hypothetical protein [Planctomycetota bacterium]
MPIAMTKRCRNRHDTAFLFCLLLVLVLTGCSADDPINISFALTLDDSKLAMREMTNEPKPMKRPVIVLGGIYDPGVASGRVANRIRRLVENNEQVISVTFLGQGTFDQCRNRVIACVEKAFPSDDPNQTVEVDVIGISMGGLVARHAAVPRSDGDKHLRIHRLFTISSPHRGAKMATLPTFDRLAIDMRFGSSFLATLDRQLVDLDYEIFPYTRLDDAIVGEENTAPWGQNPWWVANIPGSFSHIFSMHDPRIMADICRHLRDETPYIADPATPLPLATAPFFHAQ